MNKAQVRKWLESKKKREIRSIAKDLEIEFPKDVIKLADMVEHLIDTVKHADLVDHRQAEPEKKSLFTKIKTKNGEVRTNGQTAWDWIKQGTTISCAVATGWVLKSIFGSVSTIEGGDQEETEEDMTV